MIKLLVAVLALPSTIGSAAFQGAGDQAALTRDILLRAKPIATCAGWKGAEAYVPEYQWISPTDLLFIRGSRANGFELVRRNVLTGDETPLTVLSASFNRTEGWVENLRVSPDGTRLLWTTGYGRGSWISARLDGTGLVTWPVRKRTAMSVYDPYHESIASWAADGREIIETTLESADRGNGQTLVIYTKGVDPPTRKRLTARIPWPLRSWPPLPAGSSHYLLASVSDQTRTERAVSVIVGRYADKRWSVATHSVSLPPGAEVINTLVSPSGNKILWFLRSQSESSRGNSTSAETFPMGLWVSDLDGASMHELGHFEYAPSESARVYQHTGGLRWTPDGMNISFIYSGELYLISRD